MYIDKRCLSGEDIVLSDVLILHFIIGGFAALAMIYSVAILLKSYRNTKLRITNYLALAIVFLAIWAINSTIYPALTDFDMVCNIYEAGVISSYLAMFTIFIFVERATKGSVNYKMSFCYGILFGGISYLLILRVPPPLGYGMNYIPDFGYYGSAQIPFIILQLLFVLSVGILFTKMSYDILKHTEESKRQQAWLLLIGSAIAFYGGIIAIIMVEILFVPSMILLVIAIGIIIIAISFTKDPRVAYMLPYDVVLLGVLNESGVPIYTHKFKNVDIDESIFSGALSAIATLMKHALGTKESIDLVETGRYKIILELREKLGGYVIANQGSKILREGLTNLLNALEDKIDSEKEQFETVAANNIKRYFGFLKGV